MKKFSFDGYCLAHIKVNSILREKRLVLGLTQQQVADKAKLIIDNIKSLKVVNETL